MQYKDVNLTNGNIEFIINKCDEKIREYEKPEATIPYELFYVIALRRMIFPVYEKSIIERNKIFGKWVEKDESGNPKTKSPILTLGQKESPPPEPQMINEEEYMNELGASANKTTRVSIPVIKTETWASLNWKCNADNYILFTLIM